MRHTSGTLDCLLSPAPCRALLGGTFTSGAWRDKVQFVCPPGGLTPGAVALQPPGTPGSSCSPAFSPRRRPASLGGSPAAISAR
eukprot:9330988-Pyramimonas_sp.AAC.1